jgi:hypothetical protein
METKIKTKRILIVGKHFNYYYKLKFISFNIGDNLLDGIRYFKDSPDTFLVHKTRPMCRINEVYQLLNAGKFIHCHGIVITIGTFNLINEDLNANDEDDLRSLLHFVIISI